MRLLLSLTLLIGYHLLFWHEKLGINLVLFSALLAIISFRINHWKRPSTMHWVGIASVLTTGIMVVVYNTWIGKVMHLGAFLFLMGWVHEAEIRTTYTGILVAIINLGVSWLVKAAEVQRSWAQRTGFKAGYRIARITVAPILIFAVFLFIYRWANPVFGEGVQGVFDWIGLRFGTWWKDISVAWLLFILVGLLVIVGSLFRSGVTGWARREQRHPEALLRQRKPGGKFHPKALHREFQSGLIALCLVNALLLVVNVIDINYIWFGFEVPEDFSLKAFVHEGTGLLILSILLSMGILLYFFRGNQNFYTNNKWLRLLAYAWMAQNLVLGISVALRTSYYIDFHGLAYKRIGVLLFLALTLFGLLSLWVKIRNTRSWFYLVRVNSLAAFVVLMGVGCVNWDGWIVSYNLQHPNQNEIDIDNYLVLSPKTLPMVYENLDLVEQQMAAHQYNKVWWVDHLDIDTFKQELDARRDRFLEEQEGYTWASWNMADHQTLAYFEEKP